MTELPPVSVVMGVYNGEDSLQNTIDSVLSQNNCEFEFIIIDDGSSDSTSSILDANALKDRRIRVFKQENLGLTRALIHGCAEAKGEYIARQDCGDFSLPGRLERQLSFLVKNPDVVCVSCGARFLGPEKEYLYEVTQSDEDLNQGVRSVDPGKLRGPSHHGSTMFRKDAYETAGGYKYQFRVAQDLDLWTRIAAFGRFCSLPETFYEAVLTPGSISSIMRGRQVELSGIISECAKLRREGKSEDALLEQAEHVSADYKQSVTKKTEADFYYFIAGCLRSHDAALAKKYYRYVLLNNRYNIKAIFYYFCLSIIR